MLAVWQVLCCIHDIAGLTVSSGKIASDDLSHRCCRDPGHTI
jgi:hypothetical protein